MWKQIEVLKNHADVLSLPGDRGFRQRVNAVTASPKSNQLAVDANGSTIWSLQQVDASQERGLSGAGRSEYDHHLATLDIQVDAFEDLQMAKRFSHAARAYQRTTVHAGSSGAAAGRTTVPRSRINTASHHESLLSREWPRP